MRQAHGPWGRWPYAILCLCATVLLAENLGAGSGRPRRSLRSEPPSPPPFVAADCTGLPDGTSCDDANACSAPDVCQSGSCVCANTGACAGTVATFGSSTPVAIPAGAVGFVTSTIAVSGTGVHLDRIRVTASIQHTSNGDLDVTLRSPAGTVVTLTSDNGLTNDNGFGGTLFDDRADPANQVPFPGATFGASNLATDSVFTNLVPKGTLVPEEALGAVQGEDPNGIWTLTISDDTVGDGGTLNGWQVELTTFPAPAVLTTTSFTNNTPLFVSDSAVVSSSLAVSGAGATIGSVRLTTFFRHTFAADLDVTLTSPAGTVVTITSDNGGGNDDVFNGTLWDDEADPGNEAPFPANAFPASNLVTDTVFTNPVPKGTLVPEEALGAFHGEDPNGTWTLRISDDAGGDTGLLNSWSLEISTIACAATCFVVCDDASSCTDDTCDPATGCVFTPDDTNTCDDGNPGTTDEACHSGVCVPGGLLHVAAVTPANNATDVGASASVVVTYEGLIDPVTVGPSTFFLTGPGGPVPADRRVSGASIVLDPHAALSPLTTYTVHATYGIFGVGAFPPAAEVVTSRFRTGPGASDSVPISTVAEPTPALASQSRTGSAVAAAGDLNGDGIGDWLVGAPSYQEGGLVEAGAAGVYFGSADSTARRTADIVLTGAAAHERAGVSVAGDFDFNGDGRKDILIGAEQVNRTGADPVAAGSGKVYLIYFDPSDPRYHTGQPVSLALVGQPGGIPGVVFEGGSDGDQAGFAVAGGGRINAGGGDDIVIGAPGRDVPGGPPVVDAGTTYTVFDQPLSGTVSLSRVANGLADQVAGIVYRGSSAGDRLGFSVAFLPQAVASSGGHPNAGRTNTGVGSPGRNGRRGRVSVGRGGNSDTSNLDVDSIGVGGGGFEIIGTDPGEELGWSIASGGDNRADGAPDILIGAPLYDADDLVDAGRVVQTSFSFPDGVYVADDVGVTIPGTIWTGEAAGEQLGAAVAGLGDVTGDGYDDIALGAPSFDAVVDGVPQTAAGAVYLIAGGPVPPFEGSQSISEVGLTVNGQRLGGTQAGEHAGASIAGTGDIDGGGTGDFVVGAPDRNSSDGTVYLVRTSTPAPPGLCGPAGCTVVDLLTGGEVDVFPRALQSTVQLGVTGVLDPALLPGAVPSGRLFGGAARYAPDALPFRSPFATVHIPASETAGAALTVGDPVRLYVYRPISLVLAIGGWVSAGILGTVEANPSYPDRKAVVAPILGLETYAFFLVDCSAVVCDDGDPCTADACSPVRGCVHAYPDALCDGGTFLRRRPRP